MSKEKIIQAFTNLEDSVTLNCGPDQVRAWIREIKDQNPEFFYVDFSRIAFAYGLKLRYSISYLYDKRTVLEKKRVFDQRVNQAISQMNISASDSDLIKAKKIHDWIIQNTNYDYDALNTSHGHEPAYNASGVFLYGTAVCSGISKAFTVLGNKVGLKSEVISGVGSSNVYGETDHAWNLVRIGNIYAHMDVTFDLGISENKNRIRYDYFLLPDQWIRSDHTFQSDKVCPENTFNYFVSTNSYHHSRKDFEKWVEQRLRAGKKIFYFKNDFSTNIDDLVNYIQRRYIAAFRRCQYKYSTNKGQNVIALEIM